MWVEELLAFSLHQQNQHIWKSCFWNDNSCLHGWADDFSVHILGPCLTTRQPQAYMSIAGQITALLAQINQCWLPVLALYTGHLYNGLNEATHNATLGPPTSVTIGLWAHNPNLVKIHAALMWEMMIRSCHNFTHATTAELSWHVQSCDMIGTLDSKLEQNVCLQYFDCELINASWNGSHTY